MVLIQDCCSEHASHVGCEIGLFQEKNIGFDDSFDVTKCLLQIEMPDLLHMCAYRNEQPSNAKTMCRWLSANEVSPRYTERKKYKNIIRI